MFIHCSGEMSLEPIGTVGAGDGVTQENCVGWGDSRVRAEARKCSHVEAARKGVLHPYPGGIRTWERLKRESSKIREGQG